MMSARSGASSHRHMHHHQLFYKKPPQLVGESDELDVFEATRYFSGALTDSGGGGGSRGGRGYASAYDEDDARAPPRRAQRNGSSDERRLGGRSGGGAGAATLQMKAAEILKKRLHKQPSSPGAKLVSYLNSLFYQAASRRKLKCLNPVRDRPEEDEEDEEDDEHVEKGHVFMQRERRRSNGESPFGPKSSNFCGSSSFATPHFHPSSVVPGGVRRPEKDYRLHGNIRRPEEIRERDRDRENRWVLNKNAGDDESLQSSRRQPPDCFLQEHDLPAPLMVSKGRLKSFSRRREGADHEDEDDLSDSSSDLFELKICGQRKLSGNGVMSSDGLPVFATTDIGAFRRETAYIK